MSKSVIVWEWVKAQHCFGIEGQTLHTKAIIVFVYLTGQRSKLVSNPVPAQPIILEENVPIPRCALMPPNANSAQMLVWRPILGKPLCIIPPVWKKDIPIEDQVPKYDSKLCKL